MKKGEHIRKAFGKRLRELREGRALTQTGLAYESEIEPGYVSRLELGKASPSLEVIVCLARSLGCQPGDLLNDL